MCPAEFAEAVGRACKSQNGSIDGIENTLSTPDYEKSFYPKRMQFEGYQELREIRMKSCDTTGGVVMHYKVILIYVFTFYLLMSTLYCDNRPIVLRKAGCLVLHQYTEMNVPMHKIYSEFCIQVVVSNFAHDIICI